MKTAAAPTREIVLPLLQVLQEKGIEIKFAYKISETSELISCSTSHLYKMIDEGHFPSITHPINESRGPRVVTLGQIIEYLETRELEARKRA